MISDSEGRVTPLSLILFALLATLWVAPPRIYPAAALAAALLLAALGAAALRRDVALPAPGERAFLVAVAGPLLVSHLFAVDRGGAVDSLVRAAGALLVFAAARRLPRHEGRGLLALLVAGAALVSLLGIWQAVAGFDALLAHGELPQAVAARLASGRVFGRFLLPSVLASFLLLAGPVAAAGALQGSRGWRRWLAGAAALAVGVALLLTRSHGALLALTLAAGAWWGLGGKGGRRRPAALAALALAALAWVGIARGGVLLATAEGSGPAALRLRNMAAAARMLADVPVTGVGGGGFGSAYTRYRQPGDNETRFVHNAYLQMLTEHGLPFALPLGAALVGVGGALVRRRRDADPLQRGAALGLLAFLLHSAWDVALLLPATLWTAAAVAGILVGPPMQPAAWERRGQAAAWRLATATALLLAAGLGGAAAAGAWSLATARAALTEGEAAKALRHARRAAFWAPWQAEPPLLAAEILLHHPDLARSAAAGRTAAVAAASQALAQNRSWPAAHAVRARAFLAGGDAGAAAADLARAAALYPHADRYRRQLESLGEGLARWRASGEIP